MARSAASLESKRELHHIEPEKLAEANFIDSDPPREEIKAIVSRDIEIYKLNSPSFNGKHNSNSTAMIDVQSAQNQAFQQS